MVEPSIEMENILSMDYNALLDLIKKLQKFLIDKSISESEIDGIHIHKKTFSYGQEILHVSLVKNDKKVVWIEQDMKFLKPMINIEKI